MDFGYEECSAKSHRGGQLYQIRVADLHPTQSAVGLDEVYARAESMRAKSSDALTAYLSPGRCRSSLATTTSSA